MDSFFSLFDPADSAPRQKKERRRARKSEGAGNAHNNCDGNTSEPRRKSADRQEARLSEERRTSAQDDKADKKKSSPKRSAHVPEESSFLCEPDLSSDVLAKDVSYIDSFLEYEKTESKAKDMTDKKKKNTGRKSRRKKKSPPKDFIPRQCWNVENLFYPECATAYLNSRRSSEEKVSWNNKGGGWKQKNSNLGKNVNDLQERGSSVEKDFDYDKKCKRRTEPFNLERQSEGAVALGASCEREPAYSVMDKIGRASIQDDLYLAGDCSTDELEAEIFCDDDNFDDSSVDTEEESGDDVYGSLPPEPQLGNVEYKLQLVDPSDKRFQRLATQLKWRLRSGGGSAVYVIGVRDCGAMRGLRSRALRASLHTLRRMAAALRATLTHVTERRVAGDRTVAEVYIRKLADTQQSVELRLAVMGANEAGKSTLIGVLTQGELDNGRGSARLNMFRHLHEVRSGRTSSLSHEILGFDAQGNVVNYGCSELMTAERIGERSAKLVSFLDLAGHSKYQHTTVHGLTGYCPHYAMLVMSATAGISRMTVEHLELLRALDLPFFIAVTRTDLAPADLPGLQDILARAGFTLRPRLIDNEQQARTCAQPALARVLARVGAAGQERMDESEEVVPVFPVSCVTGQGLNALHSYLLALEPPPNPLSAHQPHPEEESCEFQIDEIFRMGESCGPVVGGLLARGVLREGDNLLIGPLDTGDFVPITVKTIYRNRVPWGAVRAGQSASLGLSHHPTNLRQGMVILAIPGGHKYEKPSNVDERLKNDDVSYVAVDNVNLKSNLKAKKVAAKVHKSNGTVHSNFNMSLEDLENGNSDFEADSADLKNVNSDSLDDDLRNGNELRMGNALLNGNTELRTGNALLNGNTELRTGNALLNGNTELRTGNDLLNGNTELRTGNDLLNGNSDLKIRSADFKNNSDFEIGKADPKKGKSDIKTLNSDLRMVNGNLKPVNANLKMVNGDLKPVNANLKMVNGDLKPVNANLKMVNGDLKPVNANLKMVNGDLKPVNANLKMVNGDLKPVNANLKMVNGDFNTINANLKMENCVKIDCDSSNDQTSLDRRKAGKGAQGADKWDIKFRRKEPNILQELAIVGQSLSKETDLEGNLYKSDTESSASDTERRKDDDILLEDCNDPRGSFYFQASVRVLRHSTAIYPGFQATVHIGNIRQTAIIMGILYSNNELRSGESASVVFRFVRQPEYVRPGRKMLFRDGLETHGVGTLTQVFPHQPAAV